jgi:hypothetical protein
MKMNILVNCVGFIGDIIFATSLAPKLKTKYSGCRVDYLIPLRQARLLVAENPHIDRVLTIGDAALWPEYQLHINIPTVNQEYPATVWMQSHAGIEDQSTEYQVYTNPGCDEAAISWMANTWPQFRPSIAYQANWVEKSFKFTPEEYERAVDVPNLGYGGRKHDIDYIVRELSKQYNMIPVGLPAGISQHDPRAQSPYDLLECASVIKTCDYMLGAEGGMTNLAAGVGTKTIYTTDFIWQLYGPSGIFRQLENPAMGPCTYFPEAGHVAIQPFADENEIIQTVINTVR